MGLLHQEVIISQSLRVEGFCHFLPGFFLTKSDFYGYFKTLSGHPQEQNVTKTYLQFELTNQINK